MKYLKLPLVPFALLAVLAMRLLWPRIRIRIGDIWSPRIGHMLGNTECYLCERDAGMHGRAFDIWYHRRPISNRFAAKLINRCLHVDHTRFIALVDLCNRLFQGWEKFVCEPAQWDRDIHNLFEKQPPHFKLTTAEERKGERLRRSLGIPDGAKWVCLIIRDAAYLPTLTYHRHRDTKADDYIPMAVALAQRGYYVIRMGAKVAEPFRVKHSRIIDYAMSGKRTDFMDVYLGARCAFCVSNATGFDAIPITFRRPVCYVNQVPLEYMMTYHAPALCIWKHHLKDGKRLAPAEVFALNAGQCMRADEYDALGITLEDNSPQELMDAALEMSDFVATGLPWVSDQEAFWRAFPRSISPYNGKPLHGEFRLRIGAKFLKGYQ
jgi:putative glycosyltransferase (TIGR04372 family)